MVGPQRSDASQDQGREPAGESIAAEVAASVEHLPPAPDEMADWASAAAACEREARARGPGQDAARLLHHAARIYEVRLGDLAAARACCQAAVAADPSHLPSLQAARRLAAAHRDTESECRLLELEALATPDPRRAATLHHARARLLDAALGRPDEARAAAAAGLSLHPASPALLQEHARLAAAAGRLDEALEDWRRAADAVADPRAAAQLLCSAAELAEDRLDRSAEAADLALEAFRRCPADAGARALARYHAERLGRDEALAEVLEAEGREAPTARGAALALLELAAVRRERLGRPDLADEALAAAQRRAPEDPAVLAELAHAAEAREDWTALAEVLKARVQAHFQEPWGDAHEIAAAEMRLAEVYDQRLGKIDLAADCWRVVAEIDPRCRPALAALGRYHAAAEEWEKVLETFLAERDAADDPREKAQRSFKAGELLEERLGRLEEAAERHAEALRLDPRNLASARALERLLEKLGKHGDLCQHLERELADAADPGQQVAGLLRIAHLREDRLGDLEGAAAAYRRALEIDPGHMLALRSLAVVLERGGKAAEQAEVLERAAASSEPRDAVALLTRAGEVREGLGDERRAAADWEQALALDPSHLPALRALGRLCGRAGRWEELVDMCRAEATALPTPGAAAALLVRVGDILETRLARPDEAIASYRQALDLAPGEASALRALARLYRSREDREPLLEILRADAAARAAPAERAALLHEVGAIAERGLGDPKAAAEAHREALRVDPTFAPSHRALQRLLAGQARWNELAAACQLEAQHATGDERVAALWRYAWNAAERLGDRQAAEAACREVLTLEPGHAGAAALLDRIGAAPDPSARAALAARVSEPAAARALWLAAALDRRLAGDDASPELARALQLDPGDAFAGPAAEESARAGGADRLAALRTTREEDAAEGSDRAELALLAAEAWEEAGDAVRAEEACRRCLALAPGSLPALQALRRLRARAGDWAGVREALRAEAEATVDAGLAAAALARAAEVALSRLGDRSAATDDLRRAAARDPGDAALSARLDALLESSASDADACELRESRARAEEAPAGAAREWLAAARIAAERLDDRRRALEDLERALAARPAWLEALALRARLLVAEGRPAEAARDFQDCLAQGGEPAALAALHLELASLHQGPLADPPLAMSHLNAALAAVPDHAEALARLSRIHRAARNWPGAADALRRLVAAPGPEGGERVERLLELAEVRADGFGDAAAAAELCVRALAEAPGNARALALLAAARDQAGDEDGLVAALERAAAEGREPEVRRDARLRAARLHLARGDPARAAALLRSALAETPGDAEARAALADSLAVTAPEEAVGELRKLLEADAGRADVWRGLFRIWQRARAHDRAFVAASVLRFLRAGDLAAEGAFFSENAPLQPRGPTQPLGPEDWAAVRHPLDRGPLSDLLALAGEALGAVLGEQGRGGAKVPSGHPVRRLLEEICGTLGVDRVTVLEDGSAASVAIDATHPARVLVGPDFARRHDRSQQRFLLARAAARLKAGSALADQVGPGRLGELLAAAVRQVDPTWSGTGDPDEELVRAASRALPRRLRRRLAEVAAHLRGPAPDLLTWYAALSGTADRAGLVLCGDVASALAAALRDGGAPPPRPEPAEEIQQAVRARPDLQALLRFAASEEHFRLRQRLRTAIA
ncbi:MAG TPA: tetratricopeptide repeat protein [Anaeromyxobacteraceae bacterium]